MIYYKLKPTKKLSDYVQFYWILEVNISNQKPYIHRTLANSSPELIFHYKGPFEELTFAEQHEKTFLTGIHAQTNKVRRFIVKSDFGIFGVFLYPYAIPALFGIPSLEIKNELLDLISLLGQDGKDLTEKMMTSNNNLQRLKIINQFLEQRITEFERPEIVNATKSIYHNNGLIDIKKLTEFSCLSQRQFERKFKEHIGFSPKSFSKIVRFNSLLWNYKKENATLTEIAYDFGYYDQAHFINDFKQFSGYKPKAYFSGNAKDVFYAP